MAERKVEGGGVGSRVGRETPGAARAPWPGGEGTGPDRPERRSTCTPRVRRRPVTSRRAGLTWEPRVPLEARLS